MKSNETTINWFEISVDDLKRAKRFYETTFDIELNEANMMGMDMAFFPSDYESGRVSGGLVKSAQHVPSGDGAKIYFNGNPDLSVPLSKVEGAGGQVIMPKTLIDEKTGFMAFFKDTEGNVVGLHSAQ